MKTVRIVRDFGIIAGCYAITGIVGWWLGTKVVSPAVVRLVLGENAEN